MIQCSNCGESNHEGVLFCSNCGISLADDIPSGATVPTRRLANDPDENSAKATWGSARFSENAKIIVHIRDVDNPIQLTPRKQMLVGRSDIDGTIVPDVDFAPFGAIEKGVSRRHAELEVNEDTLIIQDAGSSNGTFLNGQRLPPNQPRVLRDGDEVRFGKLVTHIYFQ